MYLFWRKDSIIINLKEEVQKLKTDRRRLVEDALSGKTAVKNIKEELEDLKSQKKRELQEVEHLVKMAKEKNEIEYQKKLTKMETEKATEMAEIQKKYYEEQMTTIKGIYEEILKRLPNVNMSIEHKTRRK